MTVFDDWQDGQITNTAALRALASDLAEVESQIAALLAPLEAERLLLRDQISQVLAKMDEIVTIPGFGKVEITRAGVVKGYDRKQLDALIVELSAEFPALAARIAACRTLSERAGGLRITREKGGTRDA
jgi:hypothetical protein